jgi:MFS family permease
MALMAAIATGSGVGAFLIPAYPALPFHMAAILLCVLSAFVFFQKPMFLRPKHATQGRLGLHPFLRAQPLLWIPAIAAFLERFCVGCLVVTFSLFAHRVHGVSDSGVGLLFASLMLTFTVMMYPLGKLGRGQGMRVLSAGGVLYGIGLMLITVLSSEQLIGAMVLLGVSGAAMFASILKLAGQVPSEHKAKSFALINAAGCFGMFIGPAFSGFLTAVLRQPLGPTGSYRAVFLCAGVIVLICAALLWKKSQRASETGAHANSRGEIHTPASRFFVIGL